MKAKAVIEALKSNPDLKALKQSEASFESAVVQFAQLKGYRVAGFRPARVIRKGKETWETPIKYDGRGLFDLFLVRERAVWLELKSEKGRVSPEQLEWQEVLAKAGQEAYIVRPSDWPEIEKILK